MNFYGLRDTTYWAKWWKDRKIDWKTSYLDTWDHPHRKLIVNVLSNLNWHSLMEVGCGAGANLVNIVRLLPGKQLGGVDVNPEAIALASKTFVGGHFKVGSVDDILMSDKSADVILSDMCLIYTGPRKIESTLRELKRVARSYLVLCEFHSDSWFNRLALRWNTGYNAHNYPKILEKIGCYDIRTYKLKEEDWPGGNPQKTFAYIIVAKITKN